MAPKKVESIHDVDSANLPCRGFRHLNQQHVTDRFTTKGRGKTKTVIGFIRMSVCQDCGTEIETHIEIPSFRTVKSRYLHPDNYLVQGGATMREARREYVIRLGFKVPEEEAD